jgi:hypothetical protein
MLGSGAMGQIVADRGPGGGAARGGVRLAGPVVRSPRFHLRPSGKGKRRVGDIAMIMLVLLSPLALLALLLGMERLERWTVSRRDDHS